MRPSLSGASLWGHASSAQRHAPPPSRHSTSFLPMSSIACGRDASAGRGVVGRGGAVGRSGVVGGRAGGGLVGRRPTPAPLCSAHQSRPGRGRATTRARSRSRRPRAPATRPAQPRARRARAPRPAAAACRPPPRPRACGVCGGGGGGGWGKECGVPLAVGWMGLRQRRQPCDRHHPAGASGTAPSGRRRPGRAVERTRGRRGARAAAGGGRCAPRRAAAAAARAAAGTAARPGAIVAPRAAASGRDPLWRCARAGSCARGSAAPGAQGGGWCGEGARARYWKSERGRPIGTTPAARHQQWAPAARPPSSRPRGRPAPPPPSRRRPRVGWAMTDGTRGFTGRSTRLDASLTPTQR
jgi:hypothetical protein